MTGKTSEMTLKELKLIKDSLDELVPDPNIDFGPAYECAKLRREEALKIIRSEIAWRTRKTK